MAQSDRTLMGLDQLLKCLGFCPYPISFFLYSLFNEYLNLHSINRSKTVF